MPFCSIQPKHDMRWLTTVVILCIVLAACGFALLGLQLSTLMKSLEEVPYVHVHDAGFKTGDLILFRHKKYDFKTVGGLDRMMSHMGIVWESSEGPVVVDMNPDANGPYASMPFTPVFQGHAVMLARLTDVVRHYPGQVFVRPLQTELTREQNRRFTEKLLGWAIHLPYNVNITNRDAVTWFAIAFSTLVPELSDLLAFSTPLSSVRLSSFCTEMIGELCKEAGLLRPELMTHLLGPIAWQHGHAIAEHWGHEIEVVP